MELNLITDLISGAQAPVATETGPETGLEELFLQLSQQVTPQNPVTIPAPVPASTLGDLLQNLMAVEEPPVESTDSRTAEPQIATVETPEHELTSENQPLAPETPVFAPAIAMLVPAAGKVVQHESEVSATDPSVEMPAQPAPAREVVSPSQGENPIATTPPLPMTEPAQLVTPLPLMEAAMMPAPLQNQAPVQRTTLAQRSETLAISAAATPTEPAATPPRRVQSAASFAERFFTQDQGVKTSEPVITKELMSQQPTVTPPAHLTAPAQFTTAAEVVPVEQPRPEASQQPELREVTEASSASTITPNVVPAVTSDTTGATTSEPATPDITAPSIPQQVQATDPMQAVLMENTTTPRPAEAKSVQPPNDAPMATESAQAEPRENQREPSPEAEITAKVEQNSAPELQRDPNFNREALQGLPFSNIKEPASQIRAPITPTFGPELAQSVSQQVSTAIAAAPDRPVELTLSPEELGRVRLSMQSTDTAMVVTVQADRQDTLDLMRRHIDTLAKDFRELGFSDISFSFSQNQQQNPTPTKSEARPELSFSEAEPSVEPIRIALTPAQSGLDLRI